MHRGSEADNAVDEDLGSRLRGHRASMGKSLVDIQNETGFRPYIILAIERGDTRAFANPGLIGGYVRQYARFLNLDPDEIYRSFCKMTGHGGQLTAGARKRSDSRPLRDHASEQGNWHFNRRSLSRLFFGNFSMIGIVTACSLAIFLTAAGYASLTLYNYFKLMPVSDPALQIGIGGIDLGGSEIQEVENSETLPEVRTGSGEFPSSGSLTVIGDLQPGEWVDEDLLIADTLHGQINVDALNDSSATVPLPLEEGDRGYTPNIVSNNGQDLLPILNAMSPTITNSPVETLVTIGDSMVGDPDGKDVSVNSGPLGPEAVSLHPVEPAWIQVMDEDGRVYIERILDRGETYRIPETDKTLYLRSGMSGFVYFQVGREFYGPAGDGQKVVKQVSLDPAAIADAYADRSLGTRPAILRMLN